MEHGLMEENGASISLRLSAILVVAKAKRWRVVTGLIVS